MEEARERRGGTWVFHAGALGDSVLVWPLLRSLARMGECVTFAAGRSNARLAELVLGRREGLAVTGVEGDSVRLSRLWMGEAPERVEGVRRVVSFVVDEESEGGERWIAGARRMFPGAVVECAGTPGSESRRAVWRRWDVEQRGDIEAKNNPRGPIVLHVGAGGETKRWLMERWVGVAAALRRGGHRVELIAGEVERERLKSEERAAFEREGGRYLEDVGELVDVLAAARVMAACDTGPGHVAAQLGVPTVALFGPTDPKVWTPVGPQVRVVSPGGSPTTDMRWLEPRRVLEAIGGAW